MPNQLLYFRQHALSLPPSLPLSDSQMYKHTCEPKTTCLNFDRVDYLVVSLHQLWTSDFQNSL